MRAIASASPLEHDEIVNRLRKNFDAAPILAAIRSRSLLRPLRVTETPTGIEREYSNRGQAFSLINVISPTLQGSMDSEQTQGAPSSSSREPWTTVTQDPELIEHLFRMYFAWQHTFFQNFPEHHFREDYASGDTGYCSHFLVNAICAAACLLLSRQGVQRFASDPLLHASDFYDTAVHHFKQNPGSTICNAAGLGILANFEAARGRLSSMWSYCGQSGRMALDLGLHLRDALDEQQDNEGDRLEERGKIHTFWGCFITDQ